MMHTYLGAQAKSQGGKARSTKAKDAKACQKEACELVVEEIDGIITFFFFCGLGKKKVGFAAMEKLVFFVGY